MPLYFFNVVEDASRKNSASDRDGTVLADASEARKEAVELARDIAGHGIHGSAEWKVVVTDENGDRILMLPLSEVRPRKTGTWTKLRAHFFDFVSRSPGAFALSVVAAALVAQAVVATVLMQDKKTYEVASAPTQVGALVAVRFVAQASAGDITKFLETNKAKIVDGPRPGGFFRVRIAETAMPQDELVKRVSSMRQEKVVDLVALQQ